MAPFNLQQYDILTGFYPENLSQASPVQPVLTAACCSQTLKLAVQIVTAWGDFCVVIEPNPLHIYLTQKFRSSENCCSFFHKVFEVFDFQDSVESLWHILLRAVFK